MAVRTVVRLTRKEIYDEVWSVAVSGMALKYSIPYSAMLKQIKDADIPIPPAGYWTKKEFNKETVIPPLQGDPNEVIELYKSSAAAARMNKTSAEKGEKKTESLSDLPALATEAKNVPQEVTLPKAKEKTASKESTAPTVEDKPEQPVLGEPEVTESWDGRKQNIYRREVLYQEVWKLPVTEVAKKYAVSDVAIHKICKSLDVPTPPLGYWAKLRTGKHVEIPPLPKSDRPDTKTGLRTENEYAQITAEQLSHLPEEDQITIMAVASQIRLTDERDKLHSKVAAYQKKAKNGQPSEITDSVAKETIPRVIRILDTIVKAIEPLGVTVDDALRFNIGQDFVMLRFSEATTEIHHELTREEKMAMLKYEDERKHGHWASKPNIRKYDHVFKWADQRRNRRQAENSG